MSQPTTLPPPYVRLSAVGQTYVAVVAALALITLLTDSEAWYAALVLVSLPLSLLAVWVGFYAGLAVGFAAGHEPSQQSWPVAIVWVLVWTMTAWVNARMGEKILRRGWSALAVGSPVDLSDDNDDSWADDQL